MMQLSREERLLHIGKMTNVRDLGGYETQEGYYTKSHKFVRSTCPSGISDDLKEKLKEGKKIEMLLRQEKFEPFSSQEILDRFEDFGE